MLKHAANHKAWALGRQQHNGFSVRKVVWGLLMTQAERRPDEEIRVARIMVGPRRQRRTQVKGACPATDAGSLAASRSPTS